METRMKLKETVDIIRLSSVPDLLILRENYQTLVNRTSGIDERRYRYLLNYSSKQLKNKTNDTII